VAESDGFFDELRREYLSEAPARLAELRTDLAAAQAGEAGALVSLRTRFHRLAGSGGSYGFPEISESARAAERRLIADPEPGPSAFDQLEAAVELIAGAFDRAALQLGLGTPP
jgi:HPt (histidine-containing phosphotransfer) domain-containing protein